MHAASPQPQPVVTPAPGPPLRLGRGDGSQLTIGDGTIRLMAILNLTPDSFFDGGRYAGAAAVRRAEELVAQGADILDVGAESTRPGAPEVPAQEEWRRLAEVLPELRRAALPVVLSVDTRHAEVAERAADEGVCLLNLPFPQDLLGQRSPAALQALLRRFDGLVLMHARGTPQTMAGMCHYEGPVAEQVAAELVATCAQLCGGDLTQRVIFDPGLGFAKDAEQSLALLGRLGWLRARLGRPLLVGASRKSFLGWATGLPVQERLIPSVAAAVLAAWQGAAIVRVHDVVETRAALRLVAAVRQAAGGGHEP
ncbi:MAG: dihydropteroate synthase [Myxococcales bacterium]|nr:dihydropteroate synthase [Myxococcota bacterium]MDW8283024.1 dihydropteroate synthase [Myxococcales bacterium]